MQIWLFVLEGVRSQELEWGHSSRFTYHPGAPWTLQFFPQHFWWPTRRGTWMSPWQPCVIGARLLITLPMVLPNPNRPWSHIAVGFLLPASETAKPLTLHVFHLHRIPLTSSRTIVHFVQVKLAGPFEVDKVIKPSAIHLKLPTSLPVHPTCHLSQLKSVSSS